MNHLSFSVTGGDGSTSGGWPGVVPDPLHQTQPHKGASGVPGVMPGERDAAGPVALRERVTAAGFELPGFGG